MGKVQCSTKTRTETRVYNLKETFTSIRNALIWKWWLKYMFVVININFTPVLYKMRLYWFKTKHTTSFIFLWIFRTLRSVLFRRNMGHNINHKKDAARILDTLWTHKNPFFCEVGNKLVKSWTLQWTLQITVLDWTNVVYRGKRVKEDPNTHKRKGQQTSPGILGSLQIHSCQSPLKETCFLQTVMLVSNRKLPQTQSWSIVYVRFV